MAPDEDRETAENRETAEIARFQEAKSGNFLADADSERKSLSENFLEDAESERKASRETFGRASDER